MEISNLDFSCLKLIYSSNFLFASTLMGNRNTKPKSAAEKRRMVENFQKAIEEDLKMYHPHFEVQWADEVKFDLSTIVDTMNK